jgi:acid phosphatase
MRHFSKIVLLLVLIFANVSFAEPKLIFAIDLIRHGDRMPIITIADEPATWPEKSGELTPIGMQQEYQLGRQLRDFYMVKYKLIPERYDRDTIYLRSTDVDRTIMSAQIVAYALYPLGTGPKLPNSTQPALPDFYQPVPIHTIPEAYDSLRMPSRKDPEFKKLITQYVYEQPRWQQQLKTYHTKLERWSKLTGVKLTDNLEAIIYLGDNLHIRQQYHIALPKGLTDTDAHEIIDLMHSTAATIYNAYPVSAYATQKLRVQIADYLKSATTDSNKLKFVLLSAHDSTLAALLGALRYQIDGLASYASDLKILLFFDQNKYYVEPTLNGKPLNLAGCQKNRCTLEQFLKILNNG